MERILDKFDYGINDGQLIEDSDYVWYINDHGLKIRNLVDKSEKLTNTYKIGSLADGDFKTIFARSFKHNNQNYIFLSVSVNNHENLMVVYDLLRQQVILAAETPKIIVRADIVNRQSNESSFLHNFDVCALCACAGGALYLFDITPNESLKSDEYNPIDLAFYTIENEINQSKYQAIKLKRVYALILNENYFDRQHFKYTLPNDQVLATIPQESVRITSIKYEKQIDSLLVGFNFGSFQVWNMKNLNIESSSSYGQLNRPIVGFSLMEPQNDPKKCVYLLTAYSTVLHGTSDANTESMMEDIDDEDEENDSSFILLYQLNYEKKRKTIDFYDKSSFYTIYVNLINCLVMFESDLTSDTLMLTNTNNFNYDGDEHHLDELKRDTALSKIISIRTLKVRQNNVHADLSLVFWTIIDKKSQINCVYYLTLFNLNNWYSQCMPQRLDREHKNFFINSFLLNLNIDCLSIKAIDVVEHRVKSLENENILSFYFEIMVLSSFSLVKYIIRPIEEQIKNFIRKQENVFEHTKKIYNLLYYHNLLTKCTLNDDKSIAVLNYLVENSEMAVVLKSVRRLEQIDTSLMSIFSLKTVLDWSWNKFKEIRNDVKQDIVDIADKISDRLSHTRKMLNNLTKIFSLFIQLNQSNDGFTELNKKLSVIKSFESFVQHLQLSFNLGLFPENEVQGCDHTKCELISFDQLQDHWYENRKKMSACVTDEPLYQHKFIVDLLIQDCKPFALVSNLLKYKTYPPKSTYEMVEIFLETNLQSEIKECLFLYFLFDVYFKSKHEGKQKLLDAIENYHTESSVCHLSHFVYGIYYFDHDDINKAYEHLRKCDLSYVQTNERYLMLFNLCCAKNWKYALNFLWLFDNLLKDRGNSVKDLEFFEIYSKLFITIYMSNKLVNEAYELVKFSASNHELHKKLFVFFLFKSEEFQLWSDVVELLNQDKPKLNYLFGYLEAKTDIKSICVAIDLYLIDDRNYEAVSLYEKYARQILGSPFSYISGMIEVVKEISPSKPLNDNHVSINQSDLRDAHKALNCHLLLNRVPPKRCNTVLSQSNDSDYIELLYLMRRANENKSSAKLLPSISNTSILKSNLSGESLLQSAIKPCLTPMKGVKFQLLNDDEEKENDLEKNVAVSPKFSQLNAKIEASPGLNLRMDQSVNEEDEKIDEKWNQNSFDSNQSMISSKSANDLATRLLEVQTPVRETPKVVHETPQTPTNMKENLIKSMTTTTNEYGESYPAEAVIVSEVTETIEVEASSQPLNEKNSSFTLEISTDEKITSVSDNEEHDPLHTSITSTLSQQTNISEMTSASQQLKDNDEKPKVAKVRRRKSQIEKLLESQRREEIENTNTPSMITRSKAKILNTPQKDISSSMDNETRMQRQTRSMTRSPSSPSDSVVSTASTTVARNSIKRRGSNRIKKPSVVLSPTKETHNNKTESEFKDEANSRYNLRTRIKTPNKKNIDDQEDDRLVNSQTTTTTPKKTRKSIKPLTARKNNLYKIDETASPNAMNYEFTFSQPKSSNVSSLNQEAFINDNDNTNEDLNSSFTFSPPRASSQNKKP